MEQVELSTEQGLRDRLAQTSWLYWSLLVVCTSLFIAPLWIGRLTPLVDFGCNLVMIDSYVRYDELPAVSARFTRQSGLMPNILAAQFADLIYPWVEPREAMRLWLSTSLLMLVGALVWMCRVFERSKWLVLLGLPTLWSGLFAVGMVHYCMALPLVLLGVCAARMTGTCDGWRGWAFGVLLGIFALVSFFTHGIGCLFLLGSSLGIFMVSLHRPMSMVRGVVLVPAAWIWIRWFDQSTEDSARIPGGLDAAFGAGAMWRDPIDAISWTLRQGHDVLESPVDSYVMLGTCAVWLVLMSVGARQMLRTRGIYAGLRQHALLIGAVALSAALFVLPAQIQRTAVSSRLIPLAIWFVLLLPAAQIKSFLERIAIGVMIVLNLWYGIHLCQETARFDREQVAPLMALLEQIPKRSRVECVEVCPETGDTVFIRRPFCHGCGALAVVERDAYTGGGGFAHNNFNPIRFRSGQSYPTVRRRPWAVHPYTPEWDYILQRGTQTWEQYGRVDRIGLSEEVGDGGRRWSLYRVRDPRPDIASADQEDRTVNDPEDADEAHPVDADAAQPDGATDSSEEH
jgi:hypothetical protein